MENSLMSEATSETLKPRLNLATLVFAGFSLLSLVACIAKGIVPMYLLEALAWGALAWYLHNKATISPTANLVVVLLAVSVAAANGYNIGKSNGFNAAYETGRKVGFKSGYELGESIANASGYANFLSFISGVEKACSRSHK